MELNLTHKTGFRTPDRFVRIYDQSDGSLFYAKDIQSGKFQCNFNLPAGRYTTTNDLTECEPRRYSLPQLPRFQRSGVIPKSVRVIYTANPNKASILRDDACIILDHSIKNLSKPQRVHIRLHEIAHYHYKTEKYCDLWAARKMLILGYNPSQVFFSVHGELSNSDSALERKEYILQACENAFK